MKELYFAVGAFIILMLILILEWYKNLRWHQKPMHNFSFYFKGKLFWYSRSIAVTLFTFCKNQNGELCILANLRGKGTPDFQGYFNAPCGYLDYHETGEMGAQREVMEETGVDVPIEKIKLIETDTSPNLNKQNVSLRYCAILDGTIEDYPLSKSNMEKDEVDEILWIPISNVDEYLWAFNHDEDIKRIYDLISKK